LLVEVPNGRILKTDANMAALRDSLINQRTDIDAKPPGTELGSPYRSSRSKDWLKFKNQDAPAVKREAEEKWG
jgi:hypothetical protein